MSESSCDSPVMRATRYADDELRIPLWVRVRIQQLGRHFVGKITLNVHGGAIANFQVEPRGGDRLTFEPK